MAENAKKGVVFTALAIGGLGVVTGLFLGGNLLPSQAKGQLYDVRETITTTTSTMVDDSGEHVNTKSTRTIEKVPRGYPFTLATGGDTVGNTTAGGQTGVQRPVQGPYDIWITGREYQPSLLTVPVGTTVTFVNKSTETHTITSPLGIFDAGIDPGQSYTYTFTKPGSYDFICSPHPEMTGTITVQ